MLIRASRAIVGGATTLFHSVVVSSQQTGVRPSYPDENIRKPEANVKQRRCHRGKAMEGIGKNITFTKPFEDPREPGKGLSERPEPSDF